MSLTQSKAWIQDQAMAGDRLHTPKSGDTTMPRFAHMQDQAVYDRNVAEGKPLCDYCDGGGNEFYGMYRACPKCGGSGVNEALLPPAPPATPRREYLPDDGTIGGPCVAPTWPEWASTEEGDWVWVRADLERSAREVASAALDSQFTMLERRGRQVLTLDLIDTEWSEEWLLRQVDPEDDPQEAAVYVHFEVVER